MNGRGDPSDLISEEEVRRWREEDDAAERARLPVGARVRWPAYPNLGVCTVRYSFPQLAFVCPEGWPECEEPLAVPHLDLERIP